MLRYNWYYNFNIIIYSVKLKVYCIVHASKSLQEDPKHNIVATLACLLLFPW